jgi:hypothetical protein
LGGSQFKTRQIFHETPSPKISREKWPGGVDQALECLLALECKHKALSSNPAPPGRKEGKKKGWMEGRKTRGEKS